MVDLTTDLRPILREVLQKALQRHDQRAHMDGSTSRDYEQFEEALEALIRRVMLQAHTRQEGLQRLGLSNRSWRTALQDIARQVQSGEVTPDDHEILVADLEALLENVKSHQTKRPQYGTSLASVVHPQ
ncbi:hypothetical protein ACFS5L_40375 [Streptomyces phyllanthi]|uniref:Uncharacterized protein n=1 Tax=Streptomyces phyllanthi TaxID=1803180 RepID=A0A5N8WG87_9ACTN|nr:hypothetical protein [Streptomyces phyllanthi]MPY45215.1 hypothetical protein [Streptomyces phyllanthi]